MFHALGRVQLTTIVHAFSGHHGRWWYSAAFPFFGAKATSLLHNLERCELARLQPFPHSLLLFIASTEPIVSSFLAALKFVKEQTGALRREEDRRKAVESALARLRNER